MWVFSIDKLIEEMYSNGSGHVRMVDIGADQGLGYELKGSGAMIGRNWHATGEDFVV